MMPSTSPAPSQTHTERSIRLPLHAPYRPLIPRPNRSRARVGGRLRQGPDVLVLRPLLENGTLRYHLERLRVVETGDPARLGAPSPHPLGELLDVVGDLRLVASQRLDLPVDRRR